MQAQDTVQQSPRTFAEITPDMINAWKAQYGNNSLYAVEIEIAEVEKDNDGKTIKEPVVVNFIIRVPSRTIIEVVGEHGKDGKLIEGNKTLIKNCVIGGDMDAIEQYGSVYTRLIAEISKLMTVRKSIVKKL